MKTLASQSLTTRKTTKQPKVFLKPGTIYGADNGQRICLHCAGQSAKVTGRDISGQKVEEFTEADASEWLTMTGRVLTCEAGCTTHRPATEIAPLQLA